ncbi:MAG: Gfo/Idh/MocA family protein [Opitutaceae bacterium]
MTSHSRTLAWGIIGTGRIAGKLAAALKSSGTSHLAAVASRSLTKARTFANEFGAARAYGAYEDLLESPEVEAVYIALPNRLHAEWTKRCAAAGKHILCEKPAMVNHAEAEDALAAVRQAGVFYMEAFMYRCHPQTAEIASIVRRGDIGEVRLIQASFAYNLRGGTENIRMSNHLAGGGIMDVGCYPMSMSRLVAGAAGGNPFRNPVEVRGAAHIGERSRVDEVAVASVKFPGGIVAALSCGTQGQTEAVTRIWGSEGHILVPEPWFPPEKNARLIVQRKGETSPTEILVDCPAPLYTREVDCVAEAVRFRDMEAKPPAMTWADTLGNMEALDAWRAAVGLTFSCEE